MSDNQTSKTVLLIDDELLIMNAVIRVLDIHGHTVIPTTRGASAVQTFEKFADIIDVVFTDIRMPDISGSEVAEKIRAIKPKVLIIAITGLAKEDIKKRELFDACLFKPFAAEDILALIPK